MCGIIGYAGKEKNAIHVLINGLKNLEYRGYDSAGIAIRENNHVEIVKSEGKIVNLEKKIESLEESTIGIGHTRWATHGGATTINSHPHRVGTVTLVHNGIIENYEKIKKDLIKEGYEFKSSTDTEVACALIDKLYKKTNDKIKTLKEANHIINGSFAFAIMFDDDVNNLYAMRKDSPLIIGIGEGCNFLASDVPAILEFTNKYILLDKDEYAVVNNDKVVIYDENENMLTKEVLTYDGDKEVAMKAGYEHFMIKEINDEPIVFDNMFKQFDADNIDDLKKSMPDFSKYKKIDIIGCGSAYHAGLLGKSLIEENIVIVNGRLRIREDADASIIANDIKDLGEEQPKVVTFDITNFSEEQKDKLRNAIKYFSGDKNNMNVQVKIGDEIKPCGAIYYNDEIKKIFDEI